MDLFAACERGAAAGCCCARAAEPSSRLKEMARKTLAKYPNVDPAMRSRMGTSYWSRTRDQACVRCVLIRFTRKVLCAKKPQGQLRNAAPWATKTVAQVVPPAICAAGDLRLF